MVIKHFKGRLPETPPEAYLNGAGLTRARGSLGHSTTAWKNAVREPAAAYWVPAPGHSARADVRVGGDLECL